MTPKEKEDWIRNLESGEYPKTAHYLHDSFGYCCLGVLIESSGIGFNTGMPYYKGSGKEIDKPYYESNNRNIADTGALSQVGLYHFGISDEEQLALMTLNDENETFKEVIEYIKENL